MNKLLITKTVRFYLNLLFISDSLLVYYWGNIKQGSVVLPFVSPNNQQNDLCITTDRNRGTNELLWLGRSMNFHIFKPFSMNLKFTILVSDRYRLCMCLNC